MPNVRQKRTQFIASGAALLMTMPALILSAVFAVPATASAAALPTTCAEVRQTNPAAGDGQYTLNLQGHSARIYCADMAGTPKEYVSLAHTGGSYNFSRYYGSHNAHFWSWYWVAGTDAVTHYRKVRIDPATLVVDRDDQTFADLTSVGANGYDPSDVNFKPVPKSMPYAAAGDCARFWSALGSGNVDLTGTDFAFDDSVIFEVGGYLANGSVNMAPSRQVVNMTGGGWCGGAGPRDGLLTLKLLTPLLPTDTTPPQTTADLPSGWQNHDVTVTLTATDDTAVAATYYTVDGGAKQTGTSLTLSTDGVHTLTYWSVDTAGNAEAAHKATVQIDETVPTVSYTGNAGSYTVDQQVSIACSATDGLSGIASDTCQSIKGAAYTFPLGSNAFSAEATDNAGNVGTGSTSFTVAVTTDSLCKLTRQFVSQSGIANALCAKLSAAGASAARGDLNAKAGQIGAYINAVQAQSGKALKAEQAAVLVELAQSL